VVEPEAGGSADFAAHSVREVGNLLFVAAGAGFYVLEIGGDEE
jgi:hypothetical protein